MHSKTMRIGHGRDIHRLFAGHSLVLGGVLIPANAGFDTHSDGDVLSHAIVDALAGALADGDLGTHFPENDPQTQDARSLDFVGEFAKVVKHAGYELEHLDSFVTLGTTRLSSFVSQMRANIAEALSVPIERVSVKIRSADGIGPEGEGVAASADVSVLLRPI